MYSLPGLVQSAFYRSWQLLTCFSSLDTWRRIRLAARRYESSVPAVAGRLLRLYLAERFQPEEALTIGLADPRKPFSDRSNHFSGERLHALEMAVNAPDRAMCRDKLLFDLYCRHFDLPVPDLYGVLSWFGSRRADGTPLATEADWRAFARTLPPSFLAKLRGGNMGRNIHAMGTGSDDPTEDAVATLARELRAIPKKGEDYLIQERLYAHEAITRLTGSRSVSTIRIFTLISDDTTPGIYGAYLRTIIGDSVTDNVSDYRTGKYTGNIIAAPDMETGRIEWAWQPYTDGVGGRLVDKHPRTGEAFADFTVPHWSALCDLVKRAASCFMPLRFIGWDVAITPDGPVLIEANELAQNGLSGQWVIALRQALKAEAARLNRA